MPYIRNKECPRQAEPVLTLHYIDILIRICYHGIAIVVLETKISGPEEDTGFSKKIQRRGTLNRQQILQERSVTIKSNAALQSKIEKVPRGIRGEKSSKDMASSRNLVSTIGALASPKMGDGTRCPEG